MQWGKTQPMQWGKLQPMQWEHTQPMQWKQTTQPMQWEQTQPMQWQHSQPMQAVEVSHYLLSVQTFDRSVLHHPNPRLDDLAIFTDFPGTELARPSHHDVVPPVVICRRVGHFAVPVDVYYKSENIFILYINYIYIFWFKSALRQSSTSLKRLQDSSVSSLILAG